MAEAPTVFPADPFDPEEDSKALKQAFKGFGSDEQAIIDIIARRSNEQRLEIAQKFKTMYGKDLIKELKSELRGNFEDVIVALMTHPLEFQAKELHKAISGLGTDERALVEILGIHSNDEVRAIKEVYEGWGRDESEETDEDSAQQDAQTLLRAGELFYGTDESAFNQILCQRNRTHLQNVFESYENMTGHEFEKAIKNEFSGTDKDVLLDLVRCIRNKHEYLARRLFKSMDGIGTDDRTLIRIIVSRSEIDLGCIKEAFEATYEKSLSDWIRDDTSGDYKRCLLTIVD